MPDGIVKGIGEQLGGLVKQVAIDVAKTPAKIIGLDETAGNSAGGKGQKGQSGKVQKGQSGQSDENNINKIAQEDEIKKQKELAQAREMLQKINQPVSSPEPTIREQIEQEEFQQKQIELEREKQAAKKQLPKIASQPRPWSILRSTRQQAGAETKQNVKAQ